MDTEKVYTTSLRLYKSRPVHHQAYRYLKEYNKDIFKTKDDFIAEAIVYFAKYLQQEEEVFVFGCGSDANGKPERTIL